MKIGILTYHRTINYGTFLQCYSFVEKMKKDYPMIEIEVIDYATPRNYFFPYYMGFRMFTLGSFSASLKYFLRIRKFRLFQKKLPLSNKVISKKTEKLFHKIKNKYDMIIVGSDTVFNGAFGFPNPFFLHDNLGCIKASYAASCYGIRLNDERKKYISDSLCQFDFIGVRDTESEQLLKPLCQQKKIYHTCEPTLFLDLDALDVDLTQLKEKIQRLAKSSKPLIGVMSTNNELTAIVHKHFGQTHTIVSLTSEHPCADVALLDLTPFEWAKVFSLFDITFTNFFHGTVFSIKNLTPVIAVNRVTQDVERIGKVEDFLIRMGLQDWYFKDIHTLQGQNEMIQKAKELIDYADKKIMNEALNKEMEHFCVFQHYLDEVLEKSENK